MNGRGVGVPRIITINPSSRTTVLLRVTTRARSGRDHDGTRRQHGGAYLDEPLLHNAWVSPRCETNEDFRSHIQGIFPERLERELTEVRGGS